jgi:DNA-binding SARP family transcriptional activator
MPRKVLCVNFLGGFSITYDDQSVVGINIARLQSLLAYLILHADTPQPRQHVAFLLWPDTSESNARNNLRQFLHQLRQAQAYLDRGKVEKAIDKLEDFVEQVEEQAGKHIDPLPTRSWPCASERVCNLVY